MLKATDAKTIQKIAEGDRNTLGECQRVQNRVNIRGHIDITYDKLKNSKLFLKLLTVKMNYFEFAKHIRLVLFLILSVCCFQFSSVAQNCGTVSSWSTTTASSSTLGNTRYTFTVNTAPSSGGDKCVDLSIQCVATGYVFVSGKYLAAAAGSLIP